MSVEILAKPTSAKKREKKLSCYQGKTRESKKNQKCFFSTTSRCFFFFEVRQVLKENYKTGPMQDLTNFRVFGP